MAGTIAITAEAAHAGIWQNHNESAGGDRRTVRRAVHGLARATGTSTAAPVSTSPASRRTQLMRSAAAVRVNHNESAGRDRRRQLRRPVAASTGALVTLAAVLAAPAVEPVLARIAVNHNESPARDAAPHRGRRARRGAAALALAAGLAAPAAALTATPAAARGCSPIICGTSGNHNESPATAEA